MSGRLARRLRLALVLALVLVGAPGWAVTQPGGTFLDDDGSPHEGAIEAIRSAGITTGCHPVGDLFCPGQPVSRAEMAAFLVRGLGESDAGAEVPFSDVASDAWYAGAVGRLAELGISAGYPDGTFRPGSPVSRSEMAAFLVRALGEEESSTRGSFVDVPPDAWYAGWVERLAALGVTRGCSASPPAYCPHAAVTRGEMASFLARSFALPVEEVPPRPSVQGVSADLRTVASGFEQPVFVASPPGSSDLYVVDQPGRVYRIGPDGEGRSLVLDISDQVRFSGEQGLLGMAFHPGFVENGRLFLDFTDSRGDTRVVEYRTRPDGTVDRSSGRVVLSVDQPASNHNGGMLAFGPDGRLYVGLGDGGGAGDQFGNAQDPSTPLGTVTRVDVDTAEREAFLIGVRNPWRFSFDGARLYLADVGQSAWEEVDVLTLQDAGSNLGWPVMEGRHCFRSASCDQSGLTLPVHEYSHEEGCSVTGGHVYRGAAIPELRGHYLFGDFCGGWVSSFRFTGDGVTDARRWPFRLSGLTSFGLDGEGEVLLTSTDGTVRRLVPSS